jgi:DNA invertase Pin-like site-specific DNA recombinase
LTLYRHTFYFPKVILSKVGMAVKYGYARVSSNTQDYAAQVEALKAAGCGKIFSEKASGKSTNGRREFDRLMKLLVPCDTVFVTKPDRLTRSSRDLHNILHELQEQGCGFVSLGESWCDTTTDVGRLVMTIMGGIAEFERSLASAARRGSSRPGARAPSSAGPLRSTPANAGALPSDTRPVRRWQSWRGSTNAARRRSGGPFSSIPLSAVRCKTSPRRGEPAGFLTA